MCGPAAVVAAAMVAAAATSAYGTYQQGQAQKRASEYQAQQNEYNAKAAQVQAQDALMRGELEKDKIRTEGARLMGEGRVAYAAGGADLTVGSPSYWELDTASAVGRDVGTADWNSRMEAAGFENQAWNYRTQAGLNRYTGKMAARSANIQAGASLLQGASQAAGSYYQMNGNSWKTK